MNDYLVVEFMKNNVIVSPIQQTQRIKYTAVDVSESYIIFGASSGGLYIFKRHPCSFIKLIPSTEGSVVKLTISPDEKIIAVATSKGTLCLFNSSDNTSRNVLIFTEHQDNIITAMKWNYNSKELYSGDNTGKISVVITNFISKTVFQLPCTTLMQLDSTIIQLDLSSHFLVVSTLTRCYLCDIETERYRQIGKKLRDGEFGVCFYGTNVQSVPIPEKKIGFGSFSILNDKDVFTSYGDAENLKIFCGRPGARIWEVQLNGVVVRTHQFREALNKSSNQVILLEEFTGSRLNFKSNSKSNLESHNFVEMHVLDNFILTFNKKGLYILDPQNVAVIFWTDIYNEIINVKVVEKYIYLWTSDNVMHVLFFTNIENLIVKSLCNKMYEFCADLCIFYKSSIKKLIPTSKKLHLLKILKEKLMETNAMDLLTHIEPLLNLITSHSTEKQSKKLSGGIFLVDNGHFVWTDVSKDDNAPSLPSTEKYSQIINQDDNKLVSNNDLPQFAQQIALADNQSEEKQDDNSISETDKQLNQKKYKILIEEYELNKINFNFRTDNFNILLNKCNSLEEITDIFDDFIEYSKNKEDIRLWSYEVCLRFIKENMDKFNTEEIEKNEFITKAFICINSNTEKICECKFPLPQEAVSKPKFYEIGLILLKYNFQLNKHLFICNEVSYMWKDLIKLKMDDDLNTLLPLIVQIGDSLTMKYFGNKFTYDLWNELIQKFIFLQKGNCLNCEKPFKNISVALSWNDLATEMIRSIGAESAVYLLLQYSENIPKGELNIDFYQSCIFATMVHNFNPKLRSSAVQFVKEVNASHFGKLLEKNLQNCEFLDLHSSSCYENKCCGQCSLPLNVPVLNKEKFVELKCGHCFHNICYKNICIFCKCAS